MFWLSYLIIAIILIGLVYAFKYDMYLTQVLIIVNMVIFIVMMVGEMYSTGVYDTVIQDLAGQARFIEEPRNSYTFLTMMFIHAGIMHVFGNIIILFFIGMPLEDRVGKRLTFIFYIIAGLIATLGQYLFTWLQFGFGGAPQGVLDTSNFGASGAVFGIMGVLVFLFPRDRITMIIPPLILPNVRVDLAVGAFIMIQTGIAIFADTGNIAHAAHFAGLAGGIILAYYAKKAGIVQRNKGPVRDYTKLKKLVDDEEKKEVYQKIIDADEGEVKEAWAEYLIERSGCPECGRSLDGEKCDCGYTVWED
ncbi:MAG: rhomboid family intramembrane serine protease [Candidatus Natronoplasma sp.]